MWGKTSMTPVFQQGREDLGNSRLVSLTLIPWKVVEQLIMEIIFVHTKDKTVMENQLHGLTGGNHAMQHDSILKLCETGLMDEGRAVDVVDINFSEPFNSLP